MSRERFVRTRIVPKEDYYPEPANSVEFPFIDEPIPLTKEEEVKEVIDRRQEEIKMTIPLIADTDSQKRIVEITEGMKDLLLYKNKKYGDSALKPKHRFYKGDSTNSILIRLDDKIGRIESNTNELPRVNDVADIIGYCTLLLISMGVTKEDLEKLKD